MKVKKINHVAVAVENIEEASAFWRDVIGLDLHHTETVESQKVKIAFFPCGESEVELVQPLDESSGTARFIAKRGAGIHHLCLEVEDIAAALAELKEKVRMSVLLITHDMGVVAETADRVVVMYAGRKVEEADVHPLFEQPGHPYTLGLLNSLPSNEKYKNAKRLQAITGQVPDLLTIGDWCPFENRCQYADEICRKEFPHRTEIAPGHYIWCHKAGQIDARGSEA